MATNKNQHFVPKCHLRPFTLDGKGHAISLLNLERKKLISNAPVKNQCSGSYFYGTDDKLERAIQSIESGYAQALHDLVRREGAPSEATRTVFRVFWLFQHLRTEAAARRAVEVFEANRDLASVAPEEFNLEIKDAVQMACRTFAESVHVVDDLKCCILINRAPVPFVTSDNPAVLTNRWLFERRPRGPLSFGTGSAGAMIFLPLTPTLMFVGYDAAVYTTSGAGSTVVLRDARDVMAVNSLQFLHCMANVYLHDASFADILLDQYLAIAGCRPSVRHKVHYAQLDSSDGLHSRYVVVSPENRDPSRQAILHSQVIHPEPRQWLRQIRVRTNGSVYTNGTGMGYVRRATALSHGNSPVRRERT